MFYLVDLISGSELAFESKRAILSYWRWRIQGERCMPALITKLDFSELNVTGKDTFYGPTSAPVVYGRIRLTDYVYSWRLKRYQVLDENRRSCDIREWSLEIEEVLKENYPSFRPTGKSPYEPRFRISPVRYTGKRSNASRRCPAFTKQRLEAYRNNFSLDMEDDLLGFTPVIDHTKPRKLDWTYKKYKTSDRQCWKRACKNQSQWARHMERAPERSMKEEITAGGLTEEEQMAQLLAELVADLELEYGWTLSEFEKREAIQEWLSEM